MARHVGASHFHNGSLSKKARSRRSRKMRGSKTQSFKDKALYAARRDT